MSEVVEHPWQWRRPPQVRLQLDHELIVDNFAGGGGASMGIEQAAGRPVDIAINHDPEALAQHAANHPQTEHYCEDVFDVDPRAVCRGRTVGLMWLSPDCKHHSKAKGGKPVDKKIRGLAWVAVRWADTVRPRVIILENVEEFEDWGPLTDDNRPCPKRKGLTFRRFVKALQDCGYRVDWKLLRACDYGAPTIRRRLFLVARRDGQPIVWPEPTHGPGLLPYNTAADCIDWSIPTRSIFGRERPLAENTLRRIARGVQRFVLEAPEPFIVGVGGRMGQSRPRGISEPLQTVTSKADSCIAVPYFIPRHGEHATQAPRCRAVTEPMPTVTGTANGASLVAAFLAKHYGGNETPGWPIEKPLSTVTAQDHHAVVAAHLLNMKGTDQRMRPLDAPAPTVCSGGNHAGLVAALMAPYYGSGSGTTGRDLRAPAPTVTSKHRLQLITVKIDGQSYVLTDIGMRMLQPRELYRAQGFPDSYIIDPKVNGKPLSKAAQVRMCGNSVPPPFARALVSANYSEAQAFEEATA
ncbi:MAG TPA: DNA cytosine methyltransferase [Gammaproteobacteria bacterium]|nr:DNA cytosine methyltransferase [Gammaproteobacteria bacterium]